MIANPDRRLVSRVAIFGNKTRFFACLGAFTILNLYATTILHAIRVDGFVWALASFLGISAVVWFALYVIVKIGYEKHGPDRQADKLFAIVSLIVLLLSASPWHVLSLPGLIILGGFGLLTESSNTPVRRMSVILLSVALSNLIGRCLLIAFGAPIVAFDAHFVAMMAGVVARNNVVDFAEGGRSFMVGLPCSSVHNMSLGFILWASVTQSFALRIDKRQMVWCAAAVTALFLVNALRLTLIAWYPSHFDALHNGMIGGLFGWLSLFAAAAIVGLGALDGARRAA